MKRDEYKGLITDICLLLEDGRKHAFLAINTIIANTYWNIGKRIVEFEQHGNNRADYGSALLERLSCDLKSGYTKGFSRRNLSDMRRFYMLYRNWQTLSAKLGWSHYAELISIENNEERAFYETQCFEEKWSVRDLRRQIKSKLFYRLPASKKEGGFLQLASEGYKVRKAEDIIKYPYVFEFLKMPSSHSEKQLEEKIANNLQMFLLELGKGFSFVARQFRMQIGNKQFYADLVFYNKILRCYVLIDLKIKGGYSGVGQMNLYLNYFRLHVNSKDDNEPIGIILFKENENIEVRYALGGVSSRIFASKYMLSLPSAEDFKKAVEGVC